MDAPKSGEGGGNLDYTEGVDDTARNGVANAYRAGVAGIHPQPPNAPRIVTEKDARDPRAASRRISGRRSASRRRRYPDHSCQE